MFDNIVSRMWNENRLLSVLFELTYRCNLDCFFCYNDRGLEGRALDLDQYKTVFTELRDMNVMFVTLSGGEPLAHPYFFELGREARNLGFAIKVKTNGHAVHGRMLERMVDEVDPFILDISLHGANAETHDRQTRVPGSFDRLLRNLEGIKGAGLRVQLNTTLTRWNENEIEEMFEIADGFGFQLAVSPQVSPRDDGDTEPLSVQPTMEGIRSLMTIQKQRATAKKSSVVAAPANSSSGVTQPPPRKLCGTGSSTLAVDPVGNVYPCVQWRELLGNIHSDPIRRIWNESAELVKVRHLNQQAAEMIQSEGPEGGACGFCQGLAALHGNPMKLYPAAEKRLAVAREWRENAQSGTGTVSITPARSS